MTEGESAVPSPASPNPGGGDVIPEWLLKLKSATPARIFVGRSGPAYRTGAHLELRGDHAAARDAVHAELELSRDLGEDFVKQYGLFEIQTCASDKQEYLRRPDLGRVLSEEGKETIRTRCDRRPDLQVVIGDGLSATAVIRQVPLLLPMIINGARERGWRVGNTFVVRYCRVGVLNDVGELLQPDVVLMLIGERPGLATAESLSAYMAYQPRTGHTDAQRNLISNIHDQGVRLEDAARRILALLGQMRQRQLSGVEVKEELAALLPPSGRPAIES